MRPASTIPALAAAIVAAQPAAACPATGTALLASTGATLRSLGSVAGHPKRCAAIWEGGPTSGEDMSVVHVAQMIVINRAGDDEAAQRALEDLVADLIAGKRIAGEIIERPGSAVSQPMAHRLERLADETIAVNGETRAALVIGHVKRPLVAPLPEWRGEVAIDRQTGLPLRRRAMLQTSEGLGMGGAPALNQTSMPTQRWHAVAIRATTAPIAP